MWDKLRKGNDILMLSLRRDSNKIITNVPALLSFLLRCCVLLFSAFYSTVLIVQLPPASRVLVRMAIWGSG